MMEYEQLNFGNSKGVSVGNDVLSTMLPSSDKISGSYNDFWSSNEEDIHGM